jgi:hypothetical protein
LWVYKSEEVHCCAGHNGTSLGRLKKEDLEFEASLGYIARPHLQKLYTLIQGRQRDVWNRTESQESGSHKTGHLEDINHQCYEWNSMPLCHYRSYNY